MTDDIKTISYRVVDEAFNKGNVAALDEMYTTDHIRHSPPYPDLVGLDALKEYVTTIHTTYPDFHIEIEELLILGDVGAARWSWTGTQTGKSEAMNLEATGKKVKVTGSSWVHYIDGKVSEEWIFQDFYGMMQQLGVISALGEPA